MSINSSYDVKLSFMQLLVYLRMLIRKCVCENANRDDIQKLIPAEVSPEIQRLLTLPHREWREDISKDQVVC